MRQVTYRTSDGRAFIVGWGITVLVAVVVAYTLRDTFAADLAYVLAFVAVVFVGPIVGGICQTASLRHARERQRPAPDLAELDPRPH
jgi:hypothetical protein